MTLYAATAAIILLWQLLPINFPALRNGDPWNNFFFIWMPVPDPFFPGIWQCALAQEFVERLIKWLVNLLIGLAPAYWISQTDYWFVSPMAAILPAIWVAPKWSKRQVEYVGHAAEIELGRRRGLARYADDAFNADWLRRHYPDLFEGMTTDDALAGLRRWRWLARILLALLSLRIR